MSATMGNPTLPSQSNISNAGATLNQAQKIDRRNAETSGMRGAINNSGQNSGGVGNIPGGGISPSGNANPGGQTNSGNPSTINRLQGSMEEDALRHFYNPIAGVGGDLVDLLAKTIPGQTSPGTTSLLIPKARTCCALGFSDTREPAEISNHIYGDVSLANVGYVYTAKAGIIDIGHVRDHIDLTKYVYDSILAGNSLIRCREGYAELNQSPQNPIEIAQAIAYIDSWSHELVTFGTFQDFSSFSPEDLPSNFLGTHIGAQALAFSGASGSFDDTVDKILTDLLNDLGVLSKAQTDRIINGLKGNWWETSFAFPKILKRNFDGKPWLAGVPEDQAPIPGFIDPGNLKPLYKDFDYTSERLNNGKTAKLAEFEKITEEFRAPFKNAGTDKP